MAPLVVLSLQLEALYSLLESPLAWERAKCVARLYFSQSLIYYSIKLGIVIENSRFAKV